MFWLLVSIIPALAILIFLLKEISKILENLQADIVAEREKFEEIQARIDAMENSDAIRQFQDFGDNSYAHLLSEERIGEPIDLRYCPVSPVEIVPGRNSLSSRYRANHSTPISPDKTPVSAESLRLAFENLFGDILGRQVNISDDNKSQLTWSCSEKTTPVESCLHFTQTRPLTLQSAKISAPSLIPTDSLFVHSGAIDSADWQKSKLNLQSTYVDMGSETRSQLFDELLQKTRKISPHDEMKQVGTNNSQVESPTVSRTIGHTSPTVFDYVSPRDMTKFDSKDRILQSIKREKSSLSPTNSSGRNSSNPSPFRPAPASPPPPPPPLASPPYGKNAKILETTAETHVKPVVVGIVPNGQETDNQQTPVKSILRHFELRVEQPVAQRSSGTNPSEIRPTKRISQLKSPTELSSPVVIKMSDKTAEKPSLQKVSEIRKNFLSPTEDLPDLIRPTNGVIKAEEKLNVDSLTPVISSDYVVDSGKLLSSNRYEVTTDYSDKRTSDNHSVISDSSACREWDPSRLLEHLYRIEYQPKAEEIRPNFIDMEGTIEHLPIGMKSMGISKAWKTHYFRTNEGRLEWFEGDKAEGKIVGEVNLAGAEVEKFEEENQNFLKIHGGRDGGFLIMRIYSDMILDKWRHSLLSHSAKSLSATYVQPVHPPTANYTKKVVIIELGNCSIRAGLLTIEPSLPQTYFPSVSLELPDGGIIVGSDAYAPDLRHKGNLTLPDTSNQTNVNRYGIDLKIVKAVFDKVFKDLRIKSQDYQILLSVPQTTPPHLIGELMKILLTQFKCKGVAMAKQSILSLYAYDITTGIVVDIGDRLNIVPVIDGYIVQGGVVSLPHGGSTVAEELRTKIGENNAGLYAFMSPVEKLILRYVMEEACYIAEDFDKEVENYSRNPTGFTKFVNLNEFSLTPDMQKEFKVDAARFTCTEGWINPKKWGLDISGLHKLIHSSVQASPMDTRRTLYRNIYLTGGATMLSGLATRLEREITKLVASSIQVQVHCSPWRNHAAFIGAQILAGTQQFEDTLVTEKTLGEYQGKLYASVF